MDATTTPRAYAGQVYFGRRWDAPAFDEAAPIATPVGEACGLCSEPVGEHDDGTLQTFVDMVEGRAVGRVGPVHVECWLRQGLGSPAHVQGRCSCTGAVEPDDQRTWREQGREVIRLIGKGAWITDAAGE